MANFLNESISFLFSNYVKATREPFANNVTGDYIRKTIPNNFFATGLIDKNIYDIKSSVGQGNWAQVPWIGIFRREITTSAMNGVYIVYLLSSDGKSLYLTFNQGCTEIKKTHTKKETIEIMRKNADYLVSVLNKHDFKSDQNINLEYGSAELAEMYQKGTVLYKQYTKQNLPSEEQLRIDLKDMLEIYEEYYNKIFNNPNSSENKSERKDLNMINKKVDNLILYGPPGTGKTYKMQHEYIDQFAKENCFVTTFHQSFSYEEFVEGLKPVLQDNHSGEKSASDVKYEIQKGVFYHACEQAAKLAGFASLAECVKAGDRAQKMEEAIKSNKIVLLCIDEINRANVSAVFGDLISLIEPSKRIGAKNEMVVQLPYSKEAFAVSANLMIVGTMNTADRSIQLLDSALRRRFRFEELLPDYDVIKNETAKSVLKAINARIRCLLDKDHQIGHSYFIDVKSELDIFKAIKDCVIPLLEEYFYNDTQKIRQILNEKDNSETNFYITDTEAQDALEKMQNDYDDEKEIYMLNQKLENVKDDSSAQDFLSHIING